MPVEGLVYVIDDDPAMRDSLDFLLGAAGLKARLFESAVSFLEALPTLEHGCIVSDVRMPNLDGLELLRRLRESNKSLPIIIMTGHGDIPLAVEAMKLGAIDFIEKPFEDDRLIGTITTALSGAAQRHKGDAVAADIASRIASLSPRERQVLEGLIAGLSNKLIARD